MATPIHDIPSGINIFRDSTFRDTLNEWAEAIRELQHRNNDDVVPEVGRPWLRVKLTDYGSADGFYEFAQVSWNQSSAAYPVVSGGITHADIGECALRAQFPDSAMSPTYIGMVVKIEPGDRTDSSGNVIWEFDAPPVVIPVRVEQVGGSDGTYSTSASWTYNVFDAEGNQILSGVSPANVRPTYGKVKPATRGYAEYRSAPGTLVLTLGLVGETPEHTYAEVITDWRYDASTHKFQKKTTRIRVVAVGTEGEWSNLGGDQPVAQTVVDNVTYNSGTHQLTQDKRTDAYVLEAGTNSDGNLINQAEACDGT